MTKMTTMPIYGMTNKQKPLDQLKSDYIWNMYASPCNGQFLPRSKRDGLVGFFPGVRFFPTPTSLEIFSAAGSSDYICVKCGDKSNKIAVWSSKRCYKYDIYGKNPLKALFSRTINQCLWNLAHSKRDLSPTKAIWMIILGGPWPIIQQGHLCLFMLLHRKSMSTLSNIFSSETTRSFDFIWNIYA